MIPKARRILLAAASLVILGGAAVVGLSTHHYLQSQTSEFASQSPTQKGVPQVIHKNITTTVFWVGEPGDKDNGNIANAASAWDGQWQTHFGGVDDPQHRSGYNPAGFTPHENPFYVALPFNDIDSHGNRKPTAAYCRPLLLHPDAHYSYCKNAWVAITHGSKTVYAQWEDVGPFEEDDPAYVFGQAEPKNQTGAKAGLDVSPAVRDYLGLSDVDTTAWKFIGQLEVPQGPWKSIVTTSYGEAL